MTQKKFTLARPVQLSLAADEIDKVLAAHDGAAALVYLAMQRSGGQLPQPKDVGMTEHELRTALVTLQRIGIVASAPELPPLQPDNELPEYTAQDVIRRTTEDKPFQGVVQGTEYLFGRKLSTPELKKLLGMHDHLGFPAEVLMTLVNYVCEEFAAEHGEGRVPTMRRIETEAYRWARDEVLTLDMAEDYIKRKRARKSETGRLLAILQIYGRPLTPTERSYISSWLELGFEDAAFAEAYDRTVTNTGKLTWPYMNKILLSWHKQGLFTRADIEAKDPRSRAEQRQKQTPKNGAAPRNDLDRAAELLRKMKEKKN